MISLNQLNDDDLSWVKEGIRLGLIKMTVDDYLKLLKMMDKDDMLTDGMKDTYDRIECGVLDDD